MEKDNFVSYILNSKKYNINNKYNNFINSLTTNTTNTNTNTNTTNILLYGPPACGKYTEALKIIEKYSPSILKYEKKMIINSHKIEHIIKISDIHYEINMENLTCNSKQLFNDIYNNIVDSIESSTYKFGIILCKNFHTINNELLDIFYSYMQKIINNNITIKFIIITQHISFIPKNILDICKTLYYSKLCISNYIKLSNTNNKKFLLNLQKTNKNFDNIIKDIDNINILKHIKLDDSNLNILNYKKSICDNLIDIILNNKLDYTVLRNNLYDILIYNLDIYECIYYILEFIIQNKTDLNQDFLNTLYFKTCEFFKYYNNNYRPIYHLESYILYIIKILHY